MTRLPREVALELITRRAVPAFAAQFKALLEENAELVNIISDTEFETIFEIPGVATLEECSQYIKLEFAQPNELNYFYNLDGQLNSVIWYEPGYNNAADYCLHIFEELELVPNKAAVLAEPEEITVQVGQYTLAIDSFTTSDGTNIICYYNYINGELAHTMLIIA